MSTKKDGDEKPSLALVHDSHTSTRDIERRQRRIEATSLRNMGHSWEEIGHRLDISDDAAKQLVINNLERTNNREVETQRAIENARLDRAQVAIWAEVLAGNLQAVDTFLRISARRSKLNGLDEPTQLDLNVNIRAEMQQALAELENLVLGEVIHSEIVGNDRDSDSR